MSDQDSQTTLRDALTANIDAAEAGTLGQEPAPAASAPVESGPMPATGDRPRDESGRFASKDPATSPTPAPTAAPQAPEAQPAKPSLTTWRKDMLPLHEKLAQGVPLTAEEAKRLHDYNIERERQYATGVSTYKAEAQQAKQLQDAMSEFIPALQQNGIEPAQWIQNLGRAHTTLVYGSPEQKLQMFARLAQDYNVPLPAIGQAQQGQLDPTVAALMAEIQHLKQNFGQVSTWQQQQEEAALQKELSKFLDTEQYPHFEQVRETMIRLLETGFAQDPDSAYKAAVRMDEQAWTAEQARQAAAATVQPAAKAAAVQKAKASAASVRTATPSGAVTNAGGQKDRRSLLAEQFETAGGGRV